MNNLNEEKVLPKKGEPSSKHKRKKLEFSKILFICVSVLVTIVIAYSMVLMWKTNDTSGLAYLIPAAFAELATATGFYYNKARHENEIKLRKRYGEEIYNETKENVNEYR